MGVKVELVLREHQAVVNEEQRVTIYEAEDHSNRDFETFWGETVSVRNFKGRTYIYLGYMKSVRDFLTGRKGYSRFIRDVTGSTVQHLGYDKSKASLTLVWSGSRKMRP